MREFFYPRSIAVIGVSSKPTNLGRNIVANLIEYGFDGIVYAVGPSGGTIETRRIYRAIGDIPDHVRFCGMARQNAGDVSAFVETSRVGRDILRALVARCMLEHHVRKRLGDLDRRVHETERCGEDELVAARTAGVRDGGRGRSSGVHGGG